MNAPALWRNGFTLVELLISTALISLLLVVLVSMTSQTSDIWCAANARTEQFREARAAFESLTNRLSQATLNPYWDYFDSAGISASQANYNGTPKSFGRQSELRFKCQPGLQNTHEVFFQAPLGYSNSNAGLENLLNTWGFFVSFGEESHRPAFLTLPARHRFRLMEYMEPSENLSVYSNPNAWLPATPSQRALYSHGLAENVVALILLPKLSSREDPTGANLAPSYAYDSTSDGPNGLTDENCSTKNQLPPVIQVTMVAVDEASFRRFLGSATTMPSLGLEGLFTTVGDLQNSANPGYARDLKMLETTLQKNKLNYRIFTTDVALRGAKWSRN
jgi:uncharacterized protein (TIGR02599 family)